MVTKRRSMSVRSHLQPDDARRVDVNDHALDFEDFVVAGQRIPPRFQTRMSDACVGQIHLADASGIMLKGGKALRVRRPEYDGVAAAGPAGIVGRISKVLDAILRQLSFLAGLQLA